MSVTITIEVVGAKCRCKLCGKELQVGTVVLRGRGYRTGSGSYCRPCINKVFDKAERSVSRGTALEY